MCLRVIEAHSTVCGIKKRQGITACENQTLNPRETASGTRRSGGGMTQQQPYRSAAATFVARGQSEVEDFEFIRSCLTEVIHYTNKQMTEKKMKIN